MNEELWERVRAAMKPGMGWTSFMGVMLIIGGVMDCLNVIGAVIGVFLILSGVYLMRASEHAEKVESANDEVALKEYVTQVNKSFKMYGIMMLITLGLMALGMLVAVALGLVGALMHA